MWAVVMDGWVPERYYDSLDSTDEYEDGLTAGEYAGRCNRLYEGRFEVRRVSEDHPRRFEKAVGG